MSQPQLTRRPAVSVLTNRLLHLGVGDDVRRLAGDIDPALSGVVVVGEHSGDAARNLRAGYPDLVVIQQPAVFKSRIASAESPFPFAADPGYDQALFAFEQTLDDYLDAQLSNGASAAVLPTGFMPPGAHRALSAAVKTANALDRDDVVLHLPLSYKWLAAAADRTKLINAVCRSRHPVAISLAHKSDPASQAGVVAGIHELIGAAGNRVSLWHCDLGVLDALAQGALGGAVGVTSTNRHIVDPGETAHSPLVHDRTPNVLIPAHQRYGKAEHMARNWYANGGDPTCGCRTCHGRAITRFAATDADKLEAHRHNLALITATQRRLLNASNRRLAWAEILADAVAAHQATASATGVLSIRPEGALKQWIALNPMPNSPAH